MLRFAQGEGARLSGYNDPYRKPTTSPVRVWAIRGFVLIFLACVAIDSTPEQWTQQIAARQWLGRGLRYLGLHQGSWPLFAPNPSVRNGWIEAEVLDRTGQEAYWRSTDWSKASIWEKFYRARHLNYDQRVVRNLEASADLADYLQRTIPEREHAVPKIRWSDSGEILPPTELTPPIVRIKMYRLRLRPLISPDAPLPTKSETMWTQQSSFLVQREFTP